MPRILVGRPSFSDWATAMDKVAGRSGGDIHLRDFDDVDEVLSHARRFRMEAVIPMTYPQMKMVIPQRERFASFGAKVVCSDHYDVVQDFDDKVRFVRFMDDNDLLRLLPEVYVTQHDGKREDRAEIRYPCIFKLAVTFGGTGSTVHLAGSKPLDLDKVARGTSYVVQEFIPGNVEYGGHFYIVGGSIRRALFYRGTRDASIHVQRGRMQTYERLETIDEQDQLEDLFASVNYNGFACVDFKVADGEVKIFEVNPRLGGTLIHNEPDLLGFFAAACGSA